MNETGAFDEHEDEGEVRRLATSIFNEVNGKKQVHDGLTS